MQKTVEKARRKEIVDKLVSDSPETMGRNTIQESVLPSLFSGLRELRDQSHSLQSAIKKAAPILKRMDELKRESSSRTARPQQIQWAKQNREVRIHGFGLRLLLKVAGIYDINILAGLDRQLWI